MPDKAIDRVAAALDRARETEGTVRAFVQLDAADAESVAKDIDSLDTTGPLVGTPFAVKEVFEVAGMAAAGGSRVFKDRVATHDATVVRRLRDAGAVLLGTQASHELTCGLDEPPTRNPWNPDCYPGGSSAGAGVSVSLGSAEFALGTDAAGSVRIPAAMTGVTGFKPSAGLISHTGVIRGATAPSIDNVGIVARDARSVSRVLDVIAGPDPSDARTLNESLNWHVDWQGAPVAVKRARAAVLGPETLQVLADVWPLDPEIASAFESACEVLAGDGVGFETVELPSLSTAIGAIVTFFSTELVAAHRDLILEQPDDYHPDVLAMLQQAATTPPEQVADAVKTRAAIRCEMAEALDAVNAQYLLTPTTPRVAMPLSGFEPGNELGSLIPFTCPQNLTGWPAISVPCGFTGSGLPIGLQVVGRFGHDADVLVLGDAYQRVTDWHEKVPAL